MILMSIGIQVFPEYLHYFKKIDYSYPMIRDGDYDNNSKDTKL